MRFRTLQVLLVASLAVCGCAKAGSSGEALAGSESGSGSLEPGATTIGPDVGAVTPVTSSALDSAAGSGVNSAALRKARGIASEGVGSVNNAERQGYGAGD